MDLFKLVGALSITGAAKAMKDIDDVEDHADKSSKTLQDTFYKVGAAIGTVFAVDKIKDFTAGCLDAAAEAQARQAQFSTVFGALEGEAKSSLDSLASATGINANRMQGSYTKIAAFAKTTGMDTANAMHLSDRAMAAVADSAAFYDRTLEDTTESLQSFLKGNFENDAALGLSCTETTRNAAANKLFGKSFKDLSEDQKQLALLQMVEDANATSGALGQAARESDTWSNQLGNVKQAWDDVKAALGTAILPLVVNLFKDMGDRVKNVSEWMQTHQGVVQGLIGVFGGLIAALAAYKIGMGIQGVISLFSAALGTQRVATQGADGAQKGLNRSMNANPILAIVSLIVMLVTTIMTLWATNEDFRNFIIGVFNAIKSAFEAAFSFIINFAQTVASSIGDFFQNMWGRIQGIPGAIRDAFVNAFSGMRDFVGGVIHGIGDTFVNVFNGVKDFVWGVIEKIKSFFNFKWELPHIKLPHFKVSGSINPIDWIKDGPPHIGVDWYAKGGIMTQPTMFGFNQFSGNAMVGGEAGPEAILPISNLKTYVSEAVSEQNGVISNTIEAKFDKLFDIMAAYFPQFSKPIVLDTGVLVSQMAPGLDEELGRIQTRRGRQ